LNKAVRGPIRNPSFSNRAQSVYMYHILEVTRITKSNHLMPTVTMVILASRTSQSCCLHCTFLCILTHSDVNNTKLQKRTLPANCKKGAKLFLDCFNAVREHKQYWNKWIATDGWVNIIKY
jgi:hypothetical protein